MEKTCHVWTCIGTVMIFIVLLPIGGSVWFGVERAKERHYMKTECLTLNASILTRRCDSPIFKNHVLASTYTCYKPWWKVMYNTTNFSTVYSVIVPDTTTVTYSKAVKLIDKHAVRKKD